MASYKAKVSDNGREKKTFKTVSSTVDAELQMKTKNQLPSSSIVDDKYFKVHDYGNKLFNDLQEELANNVIEHPETYPVVKGFKYLDHEIYRLSSEEEVIKSLLKDKLL